MRSAEWGHEDWFFLESSFPLPARLVRMDATTIARISFASLIRSLIHSTGMMPASAINSIQ